MIEKEEYVCPYWEPLNEDSRVREMRSKLHIVSIDYCESAGTGAECKYESNEKIVGCRRCKECSAYLEAKKRYIEKVQQKGIENFNKKEQLLQDDKI